MGRNSSNAWHSCTNKLERKAKADSKETLQAYKGRHLISHKGLSLLINQMNLSVSLSPQCVKITALCAHGGFHEVSSQRALTFEFFDWKDWFIILYKVFLLEHLTPHKHFYGPMNLLEEKECHWTVVCTKAPKEPWWTYSRRLVC